MPAANANDMIFSIDTSATATPTYTAVGGVRVRSLKIDNEYVDVTNTSSAGWRESLAGGGVKSVTLSCAGVFNDDAGGKEIFTEILLGLQKKMRFRAPELMEFTGTFVITEAQVSGTHHKEMEFSATFVSSGEVTVTTLAGA